VAYSSRTGLDATYTRCPSAYSLIVSGGHNTPCTTLSSRSSFQYTICGVRDRVALYIHLMRIEIEPPASHCPASSTIEPSVFQRANGNFKVDADDRSRLCVLAREVLDAGGDLAFS
jgi:hypothetical protein